MLLKHRERSLDDLISLVIPVFNEEDVLNHLLSRIKELLEKIPLKTEVIFVDDGSSDRSARILWDFIKEDRRFKLIRFSRNFGHQIAITAGMDYAIGSAIIVMDADLQDPPEVVLEMIEKWKEGYDVVYGIRKIREGESLFKRITASLFYRFLRRLTSLEIPLDTGDFRLIDKKVLKIFQSMPEKARFVRGMITWAGFKQTGIYFHREKRIAGLTKYPFRKMLKLALDGVIGFSTVPLRIALNLGLLVSTASFLYGLCVILMKVFGGFTVTGWPSLMVVLTFLGGVQLFFLGVLGEYVGRIYEESLRRPLYIVAELQGVDTENQEKC